MSIPTLDGGRLELVSQSLRELTVAMVAGHRVYSMTTTVDLTRDQVLALRDELSTWLARGEL